MQNIEEVSGRGALPSLAHTGQGRRRPAGRGLWSGRVLRSRGKCGKRAASRSRKAGWEQGLQGARMNWREEGWAVTVGLGDVLVSHRGRAVGPGLPSPVCLLMSWWFTCCAEEGLCSLPVPCCVWGRRAQVSPGAAAGCGHCCVQRRGGQRDGCPAAQLPHACSG